MRTTIPPAASVPLPADRPEPLRDMTRRNLRAMLDLQSRFASEDAELSCWDEETVVN